MPFLGSWGQWYEESEHPRGKGGLWTTKGGGATPSGERRIRTPSLPKGLSDGVGKLSEMETGVLSYMTAFVESNEINDYLRGTKAKDELYSDIGEQVDSVIKFMDATFKQSKLSQDLTVYRLVGGDFADIQFGKMKAGEKFRDKAFMSTSRMPLAAENLPATIGSGRPKLMKINLKAGQKALLTELHDVDTAELLEVILPRNTTLVFQGKQKGVYEFTVDEKAKPSYKRGDVKAKARRLRGQTKAEQDMLAGYPTKEELDAEEAAEKAALKKVLAENRELEAREKVWRGKVEARARQLAKEHGFRGRLRFTAYPRSEISQQLGARGEYVPRTRVISIYTGPLWWEKRAVAEGIIAHEIQHDKFSVVMKEYRAGKHQELDRFFKGKLRGELERTSRQISNYSYMYWASVPDEADVEAGLSTKTQARKALDLAFDETLAEIALRKQRGAFRRPKARLRERREEGWGHDVPKVWNDLYNAIDKIYRGTARPSDEELIAAAKKPVGEDEASKAFRNIGFKVKHVADLDPVIVARLKAKEPDGIDPEHEALGRGFASAVDMLRGTALESLIEHLPEVNMAFASYEPKEAGMTTATGGGQATFLINTKDNIRERFAEKTKPGWVQSYPSEIADAEYAKSHDLLKAAELEGKLGGMHELAHLADRAAGGKLTDSFMATLLLTGGARPSPREAQMWLAKNISGYAANCPQDGMAEALTKYFNEGKLPERLQIWTRIMFEGGNLFEGGRKSRGR